MTHHIWPMVAARALLALVFGLLTLTWPGVTLFALVVLFGAWCLGQGGSLLISTIRAGRQDDRRAAEIFGAVANIGIGLITLVWPGVTAFALTLLVAAWAILIGVAEVSAAMRWRRVLTGEWVLALAGVVSVVFGVVLALAPVPGALALSQLIGIYALVYAGILTVLAVRVRRLENGFESTLGRSVSAAR
jgi:uncharacterized membrane protein HdeD (DUF308 family)